MVNFITPTNLRFIAQGFMLTLYIACISILLSIIFGSMLGILRSFSKGILGKLAAIYIEAVRNTPLLLWILMIRFVAKLPAVSAGILAFTVFTSAVFGEIVRGGLNSVEKGQWEAALSQGFTTRQILIHVILPQAFKNMLPAIASQMVTTIKDTSFLWSVGIQEITGKGMILMGRYTTTADVFGIFILVAAIYFTINILVSNAFHWAQNRLNVSNASC